MFGKQAFLEIILALALLSTNVFAVTEAEAGSSEGQQFVIAVILGFSTGALIMIYLLRRLKK